VNVLESDLRTFLLTVETIVAIVVDRIFGLLRTPGSDIPALMIQRTSSTRQPLYCGTSALVSADFQLDIYAMSGQDAWALAGAVREALLDFQGSMGATRINRVFLDNEFPVVDSDPGIIRVTQLYTFWYYQE
jgi:Protein of unknown function (DUF3168)